MSVKTLASHIVFINEDLTKSTAHLHYDCCVAKKIGKLNGLCSVDGKLYDLLLLFITGKK